MTQKERRFWVEEADALWYAIQHYRWRDCLIGKFRNPGDHGECQGGIEIHHVMSKRFFGTRWLRENGIGLCSFHHHPNQFVSAHGGGVFRFGPVLACIMPGLQQRMEADRNTKVNPQEAATMLAHHILHINGWNRNANLLAALTRFYGRVTERCA
jgi:hypothetical protein